LVQPHDGRAGELGEGVMIAFACALDEPSLVHGRLGCGAAVVPSRYSLRRPYRHFGSCRLRNDVFYGSANTKLSTIGIAREM
jgi:hypothetical protein